MAEEEVVLERVVQATRLLREQLEESPVMRADTMDARGYRYAFAVGALLAFVPEEAKAELMGLIRNGTLVVTSGEGPPAAAGPGAGWDSSHPASEVPA